MTMAPKLKCDAVAEVPDSLRRSMEDLHDRMSEVTPFTVGHCVTFFEEIDEKTQQSRMSFLASDMSHEELELTLETIVMVCQRALYGKPS